MFPNLVWLRKQLPAFFPRPFDVLRKKMFLILKETIQEHRRTVEWGNPRDIIDSYLEQTQKFQLNPSPIFTSNDDGINCRIV
jgi:hypothetical protein